MASLLDERGWIADEWIPSCTIELFEQFAESASFIATQPQEFQDTRLPELIEFAALWLVLYRFPREAISLALQFRQTDPNIVTQLLAAFDLLLPFIVVYRRPLMPPTPQSLASTFPSWYIPQPRART